MIGIDLPLFQVVEEYERKGYVKKVKSSEINATTVPPSAFPSNPTRKNTINVRVVFDAAIKYEGKLQRVVNGCEPYQSFLWRDFETLRVLATVIRENAFRGRFQLAQVGI